MDLISSDLDAAKEIFKRNYARLHKIDINDLELDLQPQVFEGSYFVTGILQLKFSFKDRDKTTTSSVLLKIPQIGAMYQHGEKNFYYTKEIYMYEEVIPLMYDRVPYETISPIFYGSTDSGIIVLEDLRESGYRGYPRGSLLNKNECEVVWKSLARFHAPSTRHLDEIATRIDSMSVTDRCQNQWVIEVFPPVAEKLKKHVLPLHSENTKKFLEDFLKDFCPLFAPYISTLHFLPTRPGVTFFCMETFISLIFYFDTNRQTTR